MIGFIVTLILVGLLLIFAEVLILPGVGIAGILGLLSLGTACFCSFTQLGSIAGAVVAGICLVSIVVMTVYALRAKTWRRLSLDTKIDAKAVSAELPLSVGDKGKTLTRLAPFGSVRFGDTVVEAKALEGMLDPGLNVEIVMIDDTRIYVRPVSEEDIF